MSERNVARLARRTGLSLRCAAAAGAHHYEVVTDEDPHRHVIVTHAGEFVEEVDAAQAVHWSICPRDAATEARERQVRVEYLARLDAEVLG